MAAGGAAGSSTSGAVGVSATAMMAESEAVIQANWGFTLEKLRKLDQWRDLLRGIRHGFHDSGTRAFWLMREHTSKACQPKNHNGRDKAMTSGFGNPIEKDECGRVTYNLGFLHAYSVGDNHKWQITSGKWDTLADAQDDAGITALMWLLANQPDAVILKWCCESSVRLSEYLGSPAPASSWFGHWHGIVCRDREPNATIHASGKCVRSVSGAHAVH
jgi:hypothetical protein